MFSADEIKHLAHLARLELDDGHAHSLAKDITAILEFVSQLKKIGGDRTGDRTTARPVTTENILREDKNPHPPGVFSRELREAAPRYDNAYIRVDKIIDPEL